MSLLANGVPSECWDDSAGDGRMISVSMGFWSETGGQTHP